MLHKIIWFAAMWPVQNKSCIMTDIAIKIQTKNRLINEDLNGQ